MEHNILAFWKERGIFEKSLQKSDPLRPFVFYDGPPFATGRPHHGHLLAGTIKDIIPRYWTMKGFFVERRFGWDCHGLPIEHEIDKKLAMSTREAVKKLGIRGYNDQCRSIVDRYVNEWEKTTRRIGRWVDFDNDYKTMDAPFMESVWWAFKELWKKDLIYRGTRVMPFSTALGTPLSNFEANLNYQNVQDPAVTVLFKLRDEEVFLAVWTTTPWSFLGNLGLCVGGAIDYVKVRDLELGKTLVLAEKRLAHYAKNRTLNVVERFKGEALKGRLYEPLFDFFSQESRKGAFQILTDNYVRTDTGTGIVSIAPAFGEDDNRIMKEAGISSLVCPVDESGKFTDEVSPYGGLSVKEADKPLIRFLKETSRLYEHTTIVHSYPFCYRSDTPLIYKAVPSWFVRVERIKEKLLKNNGEINWIPQHIKEGRFGRWLAGARDWSISRNRVWGTPLPLWENTTTGHYLCMGSLHELKQHTGVNISDLHRDSVDDLTFEVKGVKGTYRRVPEVLDCWFESGSMPYAKNHYPFENKEDFEKNFPAAFIAEGLDQTRGWFYTLTVLATALFDKPAFKNVIVSGMILAKDGKKMSKRLKNYTPPDTLMETTGADALRLYLINSGLVKAEEQCFHDEGVVEMARRILLPWFNAFKFFQTYAQVDGWKRECVPAVPSNPMDQWILSELQTLKKTIKVEMESYRLYNVIPALFNLVENLTNWYIRLNRKRFWGRGLSRDKRESFETLHTVLLEFSTLMAPFTPFLSDHIYRELLSLDSGKKEESVHLCSYPECDDSKLDHGLEESLNKMQQIILLGRAARAKNRIKVKIPLSTLTIIHRDQHILGGIRNLDSYIKTELNVKTILYEQDEKRFIRLYAKPNLPVLGKRFGKKTAHFTKLIENMSPEDIATLEEKGLVYLEGESFGPSDILIFRQSRKKTSLLTNRYISIQLDTTMTEDLLQEGLAREIVALIQKMRKEKNLNVEDRISISYQTEGNALVAIKNHGDYIKRETLALTLSLKNRSMQGNKFNLEGESVVLSLSKVESPC